MVEVGREDRVRVKFYAAEIDDPSEPRSIVDDDFFRGAAGGKGEDYSPQPSRRIGRGALLVEDFTLGAVDESFQDDGAAGDSAKGSGRDGQVIANDIEF